MQLKPRERCTWVMSCWCCGLRASSVLICCLYLLLHTAALVTNFIILNDPEEHVNNIISFIDTNDAKLQESVLYSRVKPYLIKNSGEYLALPITVNLVLMVANVLACWGALTSLSLLIVPWLLLYLIYALFATSLLFYMMVLLQDIWFRVLLFLVVAPLILLHSSCWLLILRLYRAIRVTSKPTSSPSEPRPSTMYTPEPHAWDQPLPIWAIAPPQNAWDPTYLQQLDPRYSRERSRSRRSSSHSRSQSQPSTGYRHSDSVSLSEKYGERRSGYEEQSDSRYETEDQSEYRTDEEEANGLPQTDLDERETEIGESDQSETEVGESDMYDEEEVVDFKTRRRGAFSDEQDEAYRSPSIPRPKSRSDLYSMPGTTLHSSSA